MRFLNIPFLPFLPFQPLLPLLLLLVIATSQMTGCASAYKKTLGRQPAQVHTRVYLADYNTVWQSVLDAFKSKRLDIMNREGGYIQTKWEDNTAEKNFTDSFGAADTLLKAQARYRVTVSSGFYNGQESVKVSVQKDQLVQRDVLEGWVSVETDSIEEKTILYRIGRVVYLRKRLAELEQQRIQKEMEKLEF